MKVPYRTKKISEDDYISMIYKANKENIKENEMLYKALKVVSKNPDLTKEDMYKISIKNIMKENEVGVVEAAKRFNRSSYYSEIDPETASKMNMQSLLNRIMPLSKKTGRQHSYRMRDEEGKFMKFDPNKITTIVKGTYDGTNYYMYLSGGKDIIVQFKSPKKGEGSDTAIYHTPQEAFAAVGQEYNAYNEELYKKAYDRVWK